MGVFYEFADDLEATKVTHVRGPTHGLEAVLVIDNVAIIGPSISGLRTAPDVTTRECYFAMVTERGRVVGDPAMTREGKEDPIRDTYIYDPDIDAGEQVMTWRQPHEGRSAGEDEERASCCDGMAHFKVPHLIWFVDEFPRTAAGKSQKFRTSEIALEKLNTSRNASS